MTEDLAPHLPEWTDDPPLGLRFLPLSRLVPHEATDPSRQEDLARRIREEGVVRNPPIVASDPGGFLVLDGATRVAALAHLGVPHLVVQEVPLDRVDLETWHHVIRGVEVDRFLAGIGSVDDLSCLPMEGHASPMAQTTLCRLLTRDGRVHDVTPRPGVDRQTALLALVSSWEDVARVTRTTETDLALLALRHPDLAALVRYRDLTAEEVVGAARAGRRLPAGLTRFVVPGRVLRLDVPLGLLQQDASVEEKDAWLRGHLDRRQREGRIRLYREPVYLLDE